MRLALIAGRLTHIATTTACRIHVLRMLWLELCFILMLIIVKLLHWHRRLLVSLLTLELATSTLVIEVVILVITILPSMMLMRHLVAARRWRVELWRMVHVTLVVIVTAT